MGVVNTKESSSRKAQNDDLPSDFLSNTLNELQILEGHKDIVRLLVVLDHARYMLVSCSFISLLLTSCHSRIASASDDGAIMIWNYRTGVQIFNLTGHTRPITCLLLVDLHTLVSGSSDRTIRISFTHLGFIYALYYLYCSRNSYKYNLFLFIPFFE
jgi:WD40 repeat protein